MRGLPSLGSRPSPLQRLLALDRSQEQAIDYLAAAAAGREFVTIGTGMAIPGMPTYRTLCLKLRSFRTIIALESDSNRCRNTIALESMEIVSFRVPQPAARRRDISLTLAM